MIAVSGTSPELTSVSCKPEFSGQVRNSRCVTLEDPDIVKMSKQVLYASVFHFSEKESWQIRTAECLP